jgi:hypothetical protein
MQGVLLFSLSNVQNEFKMNSELPLASMQAEVRGWNQRKFLACKARLSIL